MLVSFFRFHCQYWVVFVWYIWIGREESWNVSSGAEIGDHGFVDQEAYYVQCWLIKEQYLIGWWKVFSFILFLFLFSQYFPSFVFFSLSSSFVSPFSLYLSLLLTLSLSLSLSLPLVFPFFCVRVEFTNKKIFRVFISSL